MPGLESFADRCRRMRGFQVPKVCGGFLAQSQCPLPARALADYVLSYEGPAAMSEMPFRIASRHICSSVGLNSGSCFAKASHRASSQST